MPATESNRAQAAAQPAPTVPGTLLPQREAAEVKRRYDAFVEELNPSGLLGRILIHRAATLSTRMERCVEHERAALTDRVRQALAELEIPDGTDPAEAARLRSEASMKAMFDPSLEAAVLRRYEASAERGFFRALKEFRLAEKAIRAIDRELEEEMVADLLGSSFPGDGPGADIDPLDLDETPVDRIRPSEAAHPGDLDLSRGRFDVPITIGRRR